MNNNNNNNNNNKNNNNNFIIEEKKSIIFLFVSAVSLIISFFNIITIGPIDFAWVAILLCGVPIIKDAVIGLIREFDIKADLLVSIALIAAVIIGEIFAAGEIAFIMALGGLLEEFTVAKSRAGIEKLINLTPQTARIISKNNNPNNNPNNIVNNIANTTNTGNERIINAKEVAIGDLIKVLPGETIPVDGIIIDGETAIDQSVMTGEAIPVDKAKGDEVFSGTVNQFGSFLMKATRIGKDSSLQRMINLVESADAGKAKIVRLTDKWATWIVVIALSAAIATYFLTGEIIRSVTVLVVFCPCALVLATPTAIMAAIGNLTKYGVLVKEGDALERLSQVKDVLFDKTGTLTYGKPKVLGVIYYDNNISSNDNVFDNNTDDYNANGDDNNIENINKNKLIKIVASLENRSEHPLGKAIVSYYKNKNENQANNSIEKQITDFFHVDKFEMVIGKGVKGIVEGKNLLIGNKEFLAIENNVQMDTSWIDSSLLPFIEKGNTLIYIAMGNNTNTNTNINTNRIGINGINDGDSFKLMGAIILGDSLREDSKDTVKNIEKIGLNTVLLTGDSEKPAKYMADQVGIDEFYYNCLPETKMNVIDGYQEVKKEFVAMVGDGVNDAPSLKKSHVGIAMGGIGSDIAVDAADIALIGDDIKFLPHLLGISKKVMETININIIISLVLNFVAIILAILGILDPITGALVHNVGSVLVVSYSALLLRWKNNNLMIDYISKNNETNKKEKIG